MAVRVVADLRPSAVTTPGMATSIDHYDLVHSAARQEGGAAAMDRRSEADLYSAHIPSAYCSNTWNEQEVHLPAYSGRSFPGRRKAGALLCPPSIHEADNLASVHPLTKNSITIRVKGIVGSLPSISRFPSSLFAESPCCSFSFE